MSSSLDSAAPLDTSARKAPAGSSNTNGGFRHSPPHDSPMVSVQPPRREDLQPSYAQTLVGESDQGSHGWYGSMSKCPEPHHHHGASYVVPTMTC